MKAKKIEAIEAIQRQDYEGVMFPPKRNDKRRNCIFCGKNIKAGKEYFRHFEYTYMSNQKRWNSCVKCFNKIYEEYRPVK